MTSALWIRITNSVQLKMAKNEQTDQGKEKEILDFIADKRKK